eukprot:TRINITY_DN2065_c0_g1_i1.p1 TRINITY_DN2065_c0_g1~~TRINITY_DN2065_c0_g1_i1.p1  ORF type:complete len:891 (-),score=231.98 TRINITY_DN2065_c0_g1_i1:95-2746(-)
MEELDGAIGIDLGTTYSCVAIWRNQRVEIIPNDQGNRTTPSYVAFTEDSERLVGDPARNQISKNAENTVYDAKRLIGRKFDDREVQNDLPTWPFKVIKGEKGLASIEVDVRKGEKRAFSPEEISGIILSRLKSTAELFLGKKVTKAVITVPAYFNDAQRTSTKLAGKFAGLEVLRIINEPTAAALAYGLEKMSETAAAHGKNVLVFDLGGGTFDVSLISLDGGAFEVKATAGDTHLGGQDFDNNLVQYCIKEFHKLHGVDLSEFPKAVRKLRTACEKAKRSLSSSATAEVEVDGIHDGKDLLIKVTKAKFEQLNKSLFEKCIKEVERVLSDANVDKAKVDDVVMVGGSSRIPKVQELLSKFFGGKALSYRINPDEAVAIGAAIQANILAGTAEEKKSVGDVLLLDVIPLSIGLAVNGGAMDILIKRNSTIPRRATKVFTTIDDDQEMVEVDVYEGERPRAKANHHLGMFELAGIPKGKAGEADIEVTFSVDANGVLAVSAVEKKSGTKSGLTITNTNQLSPDEVTKMIKDAEQFAKEDKELVKRLETKLKLESWAYELQEAAEAENAPESIVAALDAHVAWIEANLDTATQLQLEEHMDDLAMIYEKMGKKKEQEAEDGKKKGKGKGRKRKQDDEDDEDDDEAADPDWKARIAKEESDEEDQGEVSENADGEEKSKTKKKKEPRETRGKTKKEEAPANASSDEPKKKRLRKNGSEKPDTEDKLEDLPKGDTEPAEKNTKPKPEGENPAADAKDAKKGRGKKAEGEKTEKEKDKETKGKKDKEKDTKDKATEKDKEKKEKAKDKEPKEGKKEKDPKEEAAKKKEKQKKKTEGDDEDVPAKKRQRKATTTKALPESPKSGSGDEAPKALPSDGEGEAEGRTSEEF